jgi:hypothetical protein
MAGQCRHTQVRVDAGCVISCIQSISKLQLLRARVDLLEFVLAHCRWLFAALGLL